jgi:hypothetical protein
MQDPMPDLAERYQLCDTPVTLDGQPARIGGARNEFATVRLAGSGLSAEFAWPTVARIVSRGGDFKS